MQLFRSFYFIQEFLFYYVVLYPNKLDIINWDNACEKNLEQNTLLEMTNTISAATDCSVFISCFRSPKLTCRKRAWQLTPAERKGFSTVSSHFELRCGINSLKVTERRATLSAFAQQLSARSVHLREEKQRFKRGAKSLVRLPPQKRGRFSHSLRQCLLIRRRSKTQGLEAVPSP